VHSLQGIHRIYTFATCAETSFFPGLKQAKILEGSESYEALESESSMKLILTCGTPLLAAVPTEGCKLPLEDY
jgi:hypothetical protein